MLTQVKLTWKQHVQQIVTKAHRVFWANDDILDVHHYGKANCFLHCPDVVAEKQKEGMREGTH